MSPTDKNGTNKKMPVTLTPAPISASAALTAEELTEVIAALESAVVFPAGKDVSQLTALNIVVQPTGAAVLNVRFKN
jgi:hypothetical protein